MNAAATVHKPKNIAISSKRLFMCFEFVDVNEKGLAGLNEWIH